jgi:hypothetical protein
MRYLCLIYEDETLYERMPKDELDKIFGEYWAFSSDIKRTGHHLGGEPLQPTATATTVRVRNGKISTTDGPFAETKEQLGGFYMIEAKDLNEAIQLAARIPGARYGSVEVRPIMEVGDAPSAEIVSAAQGRG